jgi:hypothetical protein
VVLGIGLCAGAWRLCSPDRARAGVHGRDPGE